MIDYKKIPIRLSGLMLAALTMCVSCMISDYPSSNFKAPFQEKQRWTGSGEQAGSAPSEKRISPPETIQTEWWRNFQDDQLNRLIQTAVNGNIDLQIVFKRIQESGIALTENKLRNYPNANLSGSANYMKQALEEPDYLASISPTDPGGWEERIKIRNSQYENIGLVLNWELDIWGKKKQGYLAALNDYEESKALYRAEYLKLISETAKSYFEIREYDSQWRLTQNLLENHHTKLKVYQNQYAEGLIPEWQVTRQKTEVDSAEKELLEIQRSRKQAENRLAILLGKPAGEFFVPKSNSPQTPNIVRVPTGLPSDLLSRRPDIMAAAYRVKKAFHRHGEAKAARFPSISLTGNAGFASSSLSNLLKQWTLGLTPALSWSIFDGGSAQARINSNEVQLRIAEDEYRRTVMKSFEEVENALINIENRTKQKKILQQKQADLSQIHDQTLAKFEMGLLSQLELLDIVRELYMTETSLITAHFLLLDDTITLYKALGGGW